MTVHGFELTLTSGELIGTAPDRSSSKEDADKLVYWCDAVNVNNIPFTADRHVPALIEVRHAMLARWLEASWAGK
jgi:hypothetical protein